MMMLYSAAMCVALVVSAPVWGWRMARQGRYREGLRGRLGEVPSRLIEFVRGRPVIWLHAVSVGEVQAATRLVTELEQAAPGYAVVVSTTTPTGQRVARERFGVDRVFFYPLDFAFAVRACLRALRPSLLILMESELWPRVLVECVRAGVAVAVVNARVSDRSLPRYMALRPLWKPLLQHVRLLLAQCQEDARRWIAIGASPERVRDVGNLKYDVQAAEETPLTTLLRQYFPARAAVLVCGSTHAGEEDALLDCWRGMSLDDAAVMILAPRHPERVPEVEGLVIERGLTAARLTAWRLAPAAIAAGSVLLVDTVGELAALYALARVAFVGGSLLPRGGQNPLEPARFGVPVVMGPHFENFREVGERMQEAGALQIVSSSTLCKVLKQQMRAENSDEARARSQSVFESEAGATERTVAALLPLLQGSTP